MSTHTGANGQTIDQDVNGATTVLESWEDSSTPSQQFDYANAVFVKAGNGGNLYCYPPDTLSDSGLIGPPTGGGGLRTISHILYCGGPGVCNVSNDDLVNVIGPLLNPDVPEFPVPTPSCGEFPELACCTDDSCSPLDFPGFDNQYFVEKKIGRGTQFVCGIPPVLAVRTDSLGGTAVSFGSDATVTTAASPESDAFSTFNTGGDEGVDTFGIGLPPSP
jgi:hypothetical protein